MHTHTHTHTDACTETHTHSTLWYRMYPMMKGNQYPFWMGELLCWEEVKLQALSLPFMPEKFSPQGKVSDLLREADTPKWSPPQNGLSFIYTSPQNRRNCLFPCPPPPQKKEKNHYTEPLEVFDTFPYFYFFSPKLQRKGNFFETLLFIISNSSIVYQSICQVTWPL